MGTDELGYWMAFYDLYEPHLTDDRRAAKIAYYAANEFGKPVRWPEMAQHFGLDVTPTKPHAQTLDAFPDVLASVGHDMPEHIRKRFLH